MSSHKNLNAGWTGQSLTWALWHITTWRLCWHLTIYKQTLLSLIVQVATNPHIFIIYFSTWSIRSSWDSDKCFWNADSLCVCNIGLISQVDKSFWKKKLELGRSMRVLGCWQKFYFLTQVVVTWVCSLLKSHQVFCRKKGKREEGIKL